LTLGKYLEQILIKSRRQCETCNNPISQHAVEVYHLKGNIRITIKLTPEAPEKNKGWREKDTSPTRINTLQPYNLNSDLLAGIAETP
jgi:hypothetical protein